MNSLNELVSWTHCSHLNVARAPCILEVQIVLEKRKKQLNNEKRVLGNGCFRGHFILFQCKKTEENAILWAMRYIFSAQPAQF